MQKNLFGKKIKREMTKEEIKAKAKIEDKISAEKAEKELEEFHALFRPKLDGRSCKRCHIPAYGYTHLFNDEICEPCTEKGY
jgi:uncharacterized OB-fold protein